MMTNILITWLFVGGMVLASLACGPILTDSRVSVVKRTFIAFIAGPAMWCVLFGALAVAGVMYLIHSFDGKKSKT
jgi:hypothetical protein